MLGEAIRLYRCRHRLSQKEFASQVLLNQRDISDLELEKADAIERFNRQPDRFSVLRSLLNKVDAEDDSIRIHRRSEFPEVSASNEWVAFVPESLKGDCSRLFFGLDIAIVVQDSKEVQSARA